MRTGTASNAANAVVIGVDARVMGQIREALGAQAVLPATTTRFDEAAAEVRRVWPDIVIVGFDLDFEEAIRTAPQILAAAGRVSLVALAGKADPDRIRSAMRAGFREFVVLPNDAEILRQAVREAMEQEPDDADTGEVITLWGSKGGVGDVAAFLDLPPTQTMSDLLRNVHRLDPRMLTGHIAVHPSKVHVLAQPTDLDQREEVKGEVVTRVLSAVARSYPYCLVDCGSRLDEAALTAASAADRLLLVVAPDVPGVKNAWRRLALLDGLGIEKERIHLILSR